MKIMKGVFALALIAGVFADVVQKKASDELMARLDGKPKPPGLLNPDKMFTAYFGEGGTLTIRGNFVSGWFDYGVLKTAAEQAGTEIPDDCASKYGVTYHIHTKWENLDSDFAFGADCGKPNTGGHYDPLGANQPPKYPYGCDPFNAKTCEVGDLTGKFGNMFFPDNFGIPSIPQIAPRVYFDQSLIADGVDLNGRSLVIHCGLPKSEGLGARKFCAKLKGGSKPQSRPYDARAIFGADFGAGGSLQIRGDLVSGTFTWSELRSLAIAAGAAVSDSCASEEGLKFGIYDSWSNFKDGQIFAFGNQCDAANTGAQYSPFDLKLDCDPFDFSTCAIGDLSGKFGNIVFSEDVVKFGARDQTLVDDSLVFSDKSVVVSCGDSDERLFCARLTEFLN